jgi:hypothetical protein
MKEYTRGPWSKSDRIEGAIAKGRDPLAICFADNEGNIVWMNDADYTLAVEAPELLKALEAMVEYVDFMHSIGHIQRPVQSLEACAAIARAKGESK